MSRRVKLPGASELFRSTGGDGSELPSAGSAASAGSGSSSAPTVGTGRVRHDEKITVYVSSEELIALEHLRLTLRAEHGMAVDRGRIVRAAIASALAAIADDGPDADVIRRLSTQ